jgi:beta-1,4-mannosyl-glycoprotein beta-1,4-N-acetylglucosaminyltransferase
MIFDCFTFFDEVDIAEIRIRELAGIPDLVHFAIVGNRDHRGVQHAAPTMGFRERFEPKLSLDRFVFWDANIPARHLFPRERESIQRNLILDALAVYGADDDDVVIISDVDEIPRASAVQEYAASKTGLHYMDMSQHCYYLNGVDRSRRWNHGRIMRRKDMEWLGCPDAIRLIRIEERKIPRLKDAGWHFSWTGGIEGVQKKLRTFSHTELDTAEMRDPQRILEAVDGGRQMWDGAKIDYATIDESFPQCVREHPEKWAHLIRGGTY